MNSASPPRQVLLSAQEVYHSDLPDGLFRTLAQIRGLAYRFRGKRTPPLTLDGLAALRGTSRRTVFRHLAELRARGIVRTVPAGGRAFVIRLLRPQQEAKRREAAQAGGEATTPGARDDGTAATAGPHHVATYPLRWESGALSPAHRRGDAAQAQTQAQGLLQPDLDGHAAGQGPLVDVHDSAARRPANGPPSPGPPRSAKRRGGRRARRGSAKDGARSAKNGTGSAKNGTHSAKNGTLGPHVVVVHDHDSDREDHEQQHEHERAIFKNAGDLDGALALRELAGVLAEHGVRPDDAQRRAHWLLERYGAEVCERQRQVFERRCELARTSRQGLRNPVGLLCASIRGDWSLPAAENERKTARWYTDEEFEACFEH